ncbi:tetratricopeptide repeat protein [Arcanobacterium bovis]|uniref:Tetratricopeptide repeat protein n=1 Tax=Arcanobacterium bovis TaxID=2529275 RepID=A0A4Q9V031_9ACTO|nr:tetratricopeptide repeat protein [Arcanobacterium bovis]TBW21582.1 tetratricopeptide repeat protein [Arcanobacterium bovis]
MDVNDGISPSALRGAIDLAALRTNPAQGSAPTAGTAPTSHQGPQGAAGTGAQVVPGPFTLDVSTANLEQVLKNSMSLPVVMVFHSTHSENSAKLRDIMVEIANAQQGKIQVALVSTDSEREITSMFGITGVPAVAAVLQGQPVPLFQGLPERADIENTIAKLIEAAAGYGITGVLNGDAEAVAAEPELPPLHKEGQEALQRGDLEAAHLAYTKALKENPGDAEALTSLRHVELLQRVAILNPQGTSEGAQQILVAAQQAPFEDIKKHLDAADVETAYGRPDAAFGRLIDVIRVVSGDDREEVRKRVIELFDVVGNGTELVKTARKALTNALF